VAGDGVADSATLNEATSSCTPVPATEAGAVVLEAAFAVADARVAVATCTRLVAAFNVLAVARCDIGEGLGAGEAGSVAWLVGAVFVDGCTGSAECEADAKWRTGGPSAFATVAPVPAANDGDR